MGWGCLYLHDLVTPSKYHSDERPPAFKFNPYHAYSMGTGYIHSKNPYDTGGRTYTYTFHAVHYNKEKVFQSMIFSHPRIF